MYQKLPVLLQQKTKHTITSLQEHPFPKNIRAHKLSGKLSSYYSCSVDYSNRIIFEIGEEGSILLLLVGDHSIYKNNDL